MLQTALETAAKESLDETKSMIRLLVQDMLPKNRQTIEKEIRDAETSIVHYQSQAKTLVKESIKPAVEQKIAGKCRQILAEDLKIKIERQKYVSEQLKLILELLLELSSCQEIMGMAMSVENEAFNQLETLFKDVKNVQSSAKEGHDKNLEEALVSHEKEKLMKRSTLQSSDKSLLLLHQLITGKGIKTEKFSSSKKLKLFTISFYRSRCKFDNL